jgi:cation:H+ antiporter
VSKTFIGFSLLAFGTSAPEIFVVSLAAKKKHHFICSGNIVGSSLINLLLVGGICATVNPISLEGSVFSAEIIALIAVTMLAWYVFRMKRIFSRAWGIAFVATYFATMFLARG